MKLSSVSLAMLPLLSAFTVNAAVYNIVELGEVSQVRATAGSSINDNGTAVLNGAGIFNFPLDLTGFDFESDVMKALLTDEQREAAINGQIDATVLSLLTAYLSTNSTINSFQKTGELLSFISTENDVPQPQVLRETAGLFSNNEYLYAINNHGVAVGTATAPFSKISFTTQPDDDSEDGPVTSDIWVPEEIFLAGVAIKDGNVTVLPPVYQEIGGGQSFARDISNNGLIAGYTTTGLTESVKEAIEKNCDGKLQPEISCYYKASITYQQLAAVWQLHDNGTASAATTYGYLGNKNSGQPHNEEKYAEIHYVSQANAVNDSSLLVGNSTYSDSDRINSYWDGWQLVDRIYSATHATIFTEEGALPIINPEEWLGSDASVVNNNNLVAGYAIKMISGSNRSKLFYYDHNSAELKFVDGFFQSSSTYPNDINDLGQIVGKAEVITDSAVYRREHAFLFDITSNQFQDLNSLVGCNLPYTLVEANAINNHGEILATAIVRREMRDAKGDVVLDTSGVPRTEELTTTVRLQPIANGQVDSCHQDDNKQTYEREGGSIGYWLLGLFAVAGIRRYFR